MFQKNPGKITSDEKTVKIESKSIGEENNPSKKIDQDISQERNSLSYKFLDGPDMKFWLEAFDERENNWVMFDPVLNQILESKEIQ